ncbi:MAG: HAD-IB family hydrolase [Cellvibrionales bacterium]|nr:HAD-IB family hydrolase [Cellvibrionales bacterium]
MSKVEEKAAFFDVDNTLINTKSLLSFLDFMIEKDHKNINKYEAFKINLKQMFINNQPRELINRHYFSVLRGHNVEYIKQLAELWVNEQIENKYFFNYELLGRVERFKKDNLRIVLVTGSFEAILEPLNRYLKADDILCSEPEIIDGIYSGELTGAACIGEGKRQAVLKYALMHNICIEESWAFGDDDTDIPMLETVGHGVRVEPSSLAVA